MTQKIEFILHPLFDNTNDFTPIPASNSLPNWYKEMNPYINKNKTTGSGLSNATAKKCLPMFDMMTSGYLIPLMGDVYVSLDDDGNQFYEWGDTKLIEFHNPKQMGELQKTKDLVSIPKFINAWGIKTPKNYACMFTTPTNHNLPFEIFSGIVDTDTFHSAINFPFVMKNKKWTGLIKAGTPIAQVIPIKRDKWLSKIKKDAISQKLIIKHHRITMTNFISAYKRFFWQRKNYQ